MAPTETEKLTASRNSTPPRRAISSEELRGAVQEKLLLLLKANKIRIVNHSSGVFRPRYDLYDDPPSNLATATFELPGVKRHEIALNLREGFLVIEGERRRPDRKHLEQASAPRYILRSTDASASSDADGDRRDPRPRYTTQELRYGKFERKVPLPPGTQDADIKAHLAEGMLMVSWPRRSPSQPASQLTSGSSSK
ncbi:hypothetical protein BDP27DRAFT_1412533 [Rhodocollybia butyracea]|uniref:SHSP domain-containing protein n=1 Tax=Rhodocollybia butyracea TaxID=206335 RepID=A0A9P5QB13_9AGAR|nr:hypothetical protein BDP27DRAFT_1412533 [Rhodocollybia butyracea]